MKNSFKKVGIAAKMAANCLNNHKEAIRIPLKKWVFAGLYHSKNHEESMPHCRNSISVLENKRYRERAKQWQTPRNGINSTIRSLNFGIP